MSLPDDGALQRLGTQDAQARAASHSGAADDLPVRALWILDIGGVLAEGLCPNYGSAQRQSLPHVAQAAAAAALSGAGRAEATAAVRNHQRDLDSLEDREPSAGPRFAYLSRVPWLPYAAFLTGLGVAETVFNVGAFQITAEDPWRVTIMAALIGISSAMSGHLLGSSIQEVAAHEPARGEGRRSRRQLTVRATMGVLLALFMVAGMAAVSNLRSVYYSYNMELQADSSQVTVSGLPSSGAISTTTETPGTPTANEDTPTAGTPPAASGTALLMLNLMVWVVAVAAGYHHASIHHRARRHLRREHTTAAKTHDARRSDETRAIAMMVTSLAESIELIGNALSDAHKQVLLTNAAVKSYLAAYLATLDAAGISHFDMARAPELPLPEWAEDAKAQLALFREMRDTRLVELGTASGYAQTASAPSQQTAVTLERLAATSDLAVGVAGSEPASTDSEAGPHVAAVA